MPNTDSKQQTVSEKSAAVGSLQKLLEADKIQQAKKESEANSKGHNEKLRAPAPSKKTTSAACCSQTALSDLELARDKVHLFESYGIADSAGDLEGAYDAIDKAEEDHERYLIQKYNK